ncbi:MAG: TetR/AcrR family transcriptional regulator [Acidimicrobiia bacterium]|nr:TetR/AcrR family transcriptional regulator [Acidimicrobiia bacterium]
MSGQPKSDRRTARRQATIDEIVAAAWELSRQNGLGNFSMRDLGAEVGMRAQSLYGYFASKHEIYDAMFCEGNRALVAEIRGVIDQRVADDPDGRSDGVVEHVLATGRCFFTFCTREPVRYQLLFQRTIPGFEPSHESYAVAQEAYEVAVEPLRALGLSQPDVDLHVAVMAGVVAQQIANEPGGDRWAQLLDRALTISIHALAPDLTPDHEKPSTMRSSR